MSNIVGLFEDGTTGLRDGTLLSSGGAGTNAFPLAALNTVYALHYRVIDSATGLDTGQDSSTNPVFTPPTGVQVCQTSNGTFQSTPLTLTVPVTGGNQPIYLKQTAGVDAASASLGIGSLDWAAGTRVGQVGTVTPTAGGGTVDLAWSAVSGAVSYDLYHSATNSAPAYGAAPTTAGVVSGVDVAAAGGAVTYFWVRANSAMGAGAWSAVVSATPVTYYTFSNDFAAGQSLDTSRLTNMTSGGTLDYPSSNKMRLHTTAVAQSAWVKIANACDKTRAAGNDYKAVTKLTAISTATGGINVFSMDYDSTGPRLWCQYASTTELFIQRKDQATDSWQRWNFATGAWQAAGTQVVTISSSANTIVHFYTRMNASTPECKYVVCDSSDTPLTGITQMPWTAMADIKNGATASWVPHVGDTSDSYTCTLEVYSLSLA